MSPSKLKKTSRLISNDLLVMGLLLGALNDGSHCRPTHVIRRHLIDNSVYNPTKEEIQLEIKCLGSRMACNKSQENVE